MSTLVWSLPASQDLDGIYDYIAQKEDRPLPADIVVKEIYDKCQSYADAFASGSILGTLRVDLGKDVRLFSHSRWAVFFRPADKGIEILRIVDAARDFKRVLGDSLS